MVLPHIFCPRCDHLILDVAECPHCQWRRPAATGQVGQPVWVVVLEVKLPRQGTRPVAAGSSVYIAAEGGQVVALDSGAANPDQAIQWRYQLDARYACHGVAVWGEYLLFGYEYTGGFPTPQAELVLLSAKTGDELWRHALDGASMSVPAIHEGIAYFAVNTGWLYAIDLTARQELWRQKIEPPWSWAPAAPLLTPAGQLLLPSRSEQLAVFDIEQKTPAWSFAAAGWFPHTPVFKEGLVYLRCWDQHLYALEAATGREVWRFKAPRDFNSELWVGDDFLHIGVKDYREDAEGQTPTYALYTIDRFTGEQVSRYEVKGHIEGRPMATGEAVYFATDDRNQEIDSQGTLYALDARGRQLLWEPCVVEHRFHSDLLLVDSLIVAGTRQGVVYAIRWQGVAAVEAPELYLEREEWANAATALALQGDYSRAAGLYEQKLQQPLHAGHLYLKAGEPSRVIELLGHVEGEAERALAIKAAYALSDVKKRAEALLELGDYIGAAQAFIEAEDYEQAGDCYQAAQAWPEARAAYAHAEAWDKWTKLTRELELWDELVERLLAVGDYAQAAEVQLGRGLYLKAADGYIKADLHAEALAAYRQISPDQLTEQDRERIAELAEKTGEPEVAIEAYRVVEDLVTAASLAESSGHYNQALALYRQLGQNLKVAEMLEKLSRFGEAAEIFHQEKKESRAAENWERQVDQKIEQLGGIRYAKRNEQIEAWLRQAIELYEEEEEYAETEEARARFRVCADRGRLKLTQIRREPLLQICLQTDDSLVVGQGSVVDCLVTNIGWGTAREPVLYVTSRDLEYELDAVPLETLKRDQAVERQFVVTPKIGGAITLKAKVQGQTREGEPHEFRIDGSPYIILEPQAGGELQRPPARTATGTGWGSVWEESKHGSTAGDEADAVSPAELKRQNIESLRRRQALHYTNLNKLEEQAAQYGAGMAPIHLSNQIDQEKLAIEEVEEELAELEATD